MTGMVYFAIIIIIIIIDRSFMCLHLKADHALITIITTIIKIVIIYLTILTPRKSLINNLTLSVFIGFN